MIVTVLIHKSQSFFMNLVDSNVQPIPVKHPDYETKTELVD